MLSFQMKIPPCVYGGAGSLVRIYDILSKEKVNKVILFTDKGVRGAGLCDAVLALLDKNSIAYKIIDGLIPEPSVYDVERMMKDVQESQGDLLIAIGGGSVMDAAKLAAVLKGASYTVHDFVVDSALAQKKLKTVMIPTTCGTGSEATCNSIVLVPEQELKVGIVNDALIADYVILDPDLIAKLPAKIIAATGVDALAHSVECFTSKKANPFSDVYALAAAKLIFGSIKNAYADADNVEAKTNMMLGAFYAGVAITSSGTTAVHALSYPLGGKYHIAHGISNAILFEAVMKFNKSACAERLALMCDSVNPKMIFNSINEKADYIIEQIGEIVRYTQIPKFLKGFGITAKDLDFLVEAGSKVTRLLDNNMRVLSLEDIRGIYLQVL